MQEITKRVSTVLSDQFKVKADTIGADVELGALSFDSLMLIELGLVLDKEFGVVIGDGELTEEHTIDDLVELLVSKGAAA
ncbi:phosphopantetheine-binding protein [Nocardiopsis gilva YIM 90087]|uniref:Phosphopantetheine-binding protein n=1 Tax=Nocardiopsis gilva YIM 90087 TaxID=1235441 RepID=A0A223S182_9ACTN|nr:acyl carrier protein [Nocardiopsis gilva]ASU81880.1 phosphopantetheine-binding protein [Nocardiopsis gilva YIM 90087]